MQLHKGARYID